MRRRKFIFVVVALAVVAAAAVSGAAFVLGHRPPLSARLLPSADAYIYIDLRPLRAAGLFNRMPALDADYAQFVRDTGFQFERDLDQAAFAVHLPSTNAGGVNSAPRPAPETRYSEVFIGRFDQGKLAGYLRKNAASATPYGRSIIYAIPLPGRTVRVAQLSNNMVAASNTDGDFVIHEIIDRYGETFGPSGDELLRSYYPHVPLATIAWAVSRTAAATQPGNARFVLPGGYDLFLPRDTVVGASVRYVGSVQVRAEALTRSAEDAQRVSDQLSAFLALARAIEVRAQTGGLDPDLKSFFESIRVAQYQDRAELTASLSPDLLKKIVSEPTAVPAIKPAPETKKSTGEPRKHRGKRK